MCLVISGIDIKNHTNVVLIKRKEKIQVAKREQNHSKRKAFLSVDNQISLWDRL